MPASRDDPTLVEGSQGCGSDAAFESVRHGEWAKADQIRSFIHSGWTRGGAIALRRAREVDHVRSVADSPFDRLTERQRTCLRLVLERRNSSEIGRTLGVSPHAIDKSLKLAMAKIGVNSRFEAARLFAAHEAAVVGPPPPPAPPPPPPLDLGVQTPDPQASDLPPHGRDAMALPIPTRDRPTNTMAWWQIVTWGVAIGGVALALMVAALELLAAVDRLVAIAPASG